MHSRTVVRAVGVMVGATATAALAAGPATAATGFHTMFTLNGVGNHISGYVLDGHMPGTSTFEKEVWFVDNAAAKTTYQTVITIGGCHHTAKVPEPLATAVLGTVVTTNKNGAGATSFKVPMAGLAAYLQYVGIDPATLPAKIPAQLVLIKPFAQDAPVMQTAPFVPTKKIERRAVARTDCRMVATRR